MKKLTLVEYHFCFYLLIALLFLFGISSCSANVSDSNDDLSGQIPTRTQPLEPTTTSNLLIIHPTYTPSPMKDQKIVSTRAQEDGLSDRNEAVTNTPITTATQEQLLLCSPLASEEIGQLGEIISDPYNPPPPGRDERHHGVDFAYYRRNERMGIEGEGIQSILSGFVAAKTVNRLPYGNMVIIETPGKSLPETFRTQLGIGDNESLYHLYAHMKEEPLVDLGDEVECGQKFGVVGSTGYNIVNAHLHLETRIGPENSILSPMVFYDTSATKVEMENYRLWRTSGVFTHFDPMLLFNLFGK